MANLDLRRTILSNSRILIYCSLIITCSIISLPEDFKIEKGNPLNQWFVKIGWLWTLILVVPMQFMTIKTNDKETVSHAIFKIIASTILWYISTNIFQSIDVAVGFDISGHTFLLMFSNLIISSELNLHSKIDKKSFKDQDSQIMLYMTILEKSLFLLSILWDFMLLQTALYYHTLPQKAIAALWAITSWYILHIIFYNKETRGRGERFTKEHMSVKS